MKLDNRRILTVINLTFLCQLIGFGAGFVVRESVLYLWGENAPVSSEFWLILLLASHGLAAYLAARILMLSRPWQIFNLLIAPATVLYLEAALPSGVLLLAVVISLLIYTPTFWTKVPYYPTSNQMYNIILRELPVEKSFEFADLGCGFGALLSFLAKNRPNGNFLGYEISPLPFLVAWSRALFIKNLKIRFKNFWAVDFKRFSFVYAFLAPGPMEKLWQKSSAEMNKGSLLLVNSFKLTRKEEKRIDVDDYRKCRLYFYKIL